MIRGTMMLRLAIALAFFSGSARAQVRDVPLIRAPLGGTVGAQPGGNLIAPTQFTVPSAFIDPTLPASLIVTPSPQATPSAIANPTTQPVAVSKPVTGAKEQAEHRPAQPPAARENTKPQPSAEKPQEQARGQAKLATLNTGGDAGRAIFDGDQQPSGAPVPVSEDPVARVAAGFQRFVASVMGAQKPDDRQTKSLLEVYLEERGIAAESWAALELERRLLPPQPQVSPRLRDYAPALRRLSKDYGVPITRLESMIREHELLSYLAGPQEADLLERTLGQLLDQEATLAVVADYPDTKQGRAMRRFAEQVSSRSGTSIEEVTRAGAFMYVDFHGRAVSQVRSGRDPDLQSTDVVFYGLLERGRWTMGVYRQNTRRGVSGPDANYIRALRQWLVAGGVPEADLAF